jgi:hypothetical protein
MFFDPSTIVLRDREAKSGHDDGEILESKILCRKMKSIPVQE